MIGRITRAGLLVSVSMLAMAACARTSTPPNVSRAVESVSLTPGCNQVTLTWPAGTPYATVAGAVGRADALEAIWRYDDSGASVIAYARRDIRREPLVTTAEGESALICLTAASVLTRPRIRGTSTPQAQAARAVVAPIPPDGLPPPASDSGKPAGIVSAPTRSDPATAQASAAAEPPPAATSAPALAPDPTAWVPTPPFGTLPPGSALPDEALCAEAVPRSPWEPRTENQRANNTRGQQMTKQPLRGLDYQRVAGNFTGTTDEIIQWGACKWGIDADLVRAIAVQESWWRQSGIGDQGTSFGLLQVKATAHPGTYPYSFESTAFNVDYVLAWLRGCFEGNYAYWLPAESRSDLWGCVGTWYSGVWKDNDSYFYTGLIQRRLGERMWLRPGF